MDFINVKIKSGNIFYTSSKDAQIGYSLVETSFGDVYHKTFDSLEGNLVAVKIKPKKDQFPEVVELFLKESDEVTYVLSIPTLDARTSVTKFAQSLAQILPNVSLNKQTVITLNTTAKDKNNYLYANIYITQDGEKISWAYENKDIPGPTKTINKVTKEETLDWSDRNAFIYDKIKVSVEKLSKQAVKDHTKDYNTSAGKSLAEELTGNIPDDLPF
jgi:hypothetical protein